MSDEFLGPLAQYAIQMHVVYQAFLQAGFTEDQAFRLVVESWKAVVSNAQNLPGGNE